MTILLDRRSLLTGLAAAGAISALPAIAKDKAPAQVTLSSRDDGAAQADTLVTRYGNLAVPAGGRVLPFFQVELVTESGKRVEDRKYHANATASSTFQVDGIDRTAVQSAVDRLHAAYLADLTAAGFVLISDEEAEASEAWRKLKGGLRASPAEADTSDGGHSIFFGPSGKGIYMAAGDQRLMGKGFAGLAGFGGVMDQATSEYYLPTQLQGAMVGLELAVGFVDIATSGGGKYSNIFGTGEASVKGKAMMQVIPERSRLWFLHYPKSDKGRQELVLGKTVLPASNPVKGTSDVTTKGQKLGDAAGTAIGLLTGTGGSYSSKTFRIDLDQAAFPVALESSLGGVSAAMVKRLAGLPSAPAGKSR